MFSEDRQSTGEDTAVIQAGQGGPGCNAVNRTRLTLHSSQQHWRGGKSAVGGRGGSGQETGGKQLQV